MYPTVSLLEKTSGRQPLAVFAHAHEERNDG